MSTRPHPDVVWYNNSWLDFLKILNYVPKERKIYCKKWALIILSQLNIAMAHRNYFRQNNLRILTFWQHIQRLKITILGANWQLFRLERIAKCSYFILSTQNIKFYWFVMKIKNLCCQFDNTREVYILLGINIWGLRSEWVRYILRENQRYPSSHAWVSTH